MKPGYLGPNWKSSVGNDMNLQFDGLLGDTPTHGIIIASDKDGARYVVVPAEQFGEVLSNCTEIASVWKGYAPAQDQPRSQRTT